MIYLANICTRNNSYQQKTKTKYKYFKSFPTHYVNYDKSLSGTVDKILSSNN